MLSSRKIQNATKAALTRSNFAAASNWNLNYHWDINSRSDATPSNSKRDSLMLSSRKIQNATKAALTRSNFAAGVEE
jgi:hypothetical protein